MLAPPGCGGCGINGEEFAADENGSVEIPDEARAELLSHGFTDYTDEAAQAPARKAGRPKKETSAE